MPTEIDSLASSRLVPCGCQRLRLLIRLSPEMSLNCRVASFCLRSRCLKSRCLKTPRRCHLHTLAQVECSRRFNTVPSNASYHVDPCGSLPHYHASEPQGLVQAQILMTPIPDLFLADVYLFLADVWYSGKSARV